MNFNFEQQEDSSKLIKQGTRWMCQRQGMMLGDLYHGPKDR